MKSTITCIAVVLLVAANAQPWRRELSNFRGSASGHALLRGTGSAPGRHLGGAVDPWWSLTNAIEPNERSSTATTSSSGTTSTAAEAVSEDPFGRNPWDAAANSGQVADPWWSLTNAIEPNERSSTATTSSSGTTSTAAEAVAHTCLDTHEGNKDGGQVKIWMCVSQADPHVANQQWTYNPLTGQIKGKGGKCLDSEERNRDGGRVHMWTCLGATHPHAANQQWKLDPTTGQIKSGSFPRDSAHVDCPSRAAEGRCTDPEHARFMAIHCPATCYGYPAPPLEYRGEWRWLDQGSGEQTWSCSTSWEAATDTSTSESFTHGFEQSVTASGGVKFFGVGVDIEASAGASQEWSSAVERTISQVRGGEEAAQCGSPVCTGGSLYRWAVRRYIGGAPAEELETCSFVCIRNSLNRFAKPKCPVGWCGQEPDPDSASGTGDCQCCNGIEWAADTTDEDARRLTCPGATDPNGDPYPWMVTATPPASGGDTSCCRSVQPHIGDAWCQNDCAGTVASYPDTCVVTACGGGGSDDPAPVAAPAGASLPAAVGTHGATSSILLNGAFCYNCN